ncbi:MAG: helix-turn-helix transcriptional regulator [Eubacterium sp.]|nr:helix-turn-helix transcriptional regulator [Eubacterium sp.]
MKELLRDGKTDVCMQNREIGRRLKGIRIGANLAVKQMADFFDISSTHYRRIEKGEHPLRLDQVVMIHRLFDVNLNYLLAGDECFGAPDAVRDNDRRGFRVMEEFFGYCCDQSDNEMMTNML